MRNFKRRNSKSCISSLLLVPPASESVRPCRLLVRVPPPPGSHRWDLWSLESARDFRFDAIRCSLLFEDLISEGASFGPRVLSRRDGLFAGEFLRSSSGRLCCRMGHLCVRFTRTCLYFEFCFVIFWNFTLLRLKLAYLVVVLIIWFFVLSLYMWFLNTISLAIIYNFRR